MHKTNLRKSLSMILGVSLFGVSVFNIHPQVSEARPSIDQSLVNEAVNQPLTAFSGITFSNSMDQSKNAKAMFFLMTIAHYNPNLSSDSGVYVKTRALKHLRNLIDGGNEPPAAGGQSGLVHNVIAQSIVIAKNTPAIWNELSSKEIEKIDLLMKSLAIAANWNFNDSNKFLTSLDQKGDFNKQYSTTYKNGYGMVAIAASLYFGASELNRIFQDFSYDQMIENLRNVDFTNIVAAWTKTGKDLMENGGKDEFYGSGAGVKTTYTYEGIPLSDPFGIYERLASFTFSGVVTNKSKNGRGYILSGSSPVLGETGMIREFQANDGQGERSDAGYAYRGWYNTLTTRIALEITGEWNSGSVAKRTQEKMDVGTTDLFYKLEKGYQGYVKGGDVLVKESGMPAQEGFYFEKELYNKVIMKKETATPRPEPSAKQTWKEFTSYEEGAVVRYDGSEYVSQKAHISLKSWEPTENKLLWKKR